MLFVLAGTTEVRSSIYNTPAEFWQARNLKELIEQSMETRVELGQNQSSAGPTCNGGRFAREFGFEPQGLRERLSRLKASRLKMLGRMALL